MEKKKNPESVALDNQTIDFIAPSAFYNQVPKASTKESEVKPISGNHPAAIKSEVEVSTEIVTVNKGMETSAVSKPAPVNAKAQVTPEKPKETLEKTSEAPPAETTTYGKKPIINRPTKRVSGLSISSLNAKKQHELNKIEVVIDENNLPKDNFTEEELRKHWAGFIEIIDKKGQKILASNLHSDIPKLKENFAIHIELPDGTMKKEIEREQFELMEYLRAKLNNHFVHLVITVNETTVTKFAFTPEEKYEKLREKNPVIDLLRTEFDLYL